jgi:hypothetical protein
MFYYLFRVNWKNECPLKEWSGGVWLRERKGRNNGDEVERSQHQERVSERGRRREEVGLEGFE